MSWSVDPDYIAEADVVVVPGSKSTVSDLAWLRDTGIAAAIEQRAAAGKFVIGICGGFQMMCSQITDPVESGNPEPVPGLQLFDADIAFSPEKTLISHSDGAYEVHHGQVVRSQEQPWIGDEGCQKGHLLGTHRHGQLENDAFRKELLITIAAAIGKTGFRVDETMSFAAERLRQIDLIADTIESCWDLDKLLDDVGFRA